MQQSQQIAFRIRDLQGKINVIKININQTLKDLLKLVNELTKIPVHQLILKSGYPLTIIDQPESTLIMKLNLQDGEQIIVEQDSTKKVLSKDQINKDLPTQQTPNEDGMVMIRRIIPANNSCLFLSIAYALENKTKDQKCVSKLRNIVSQKIAEHPEYYNQTVLDKSNKDYQEWIKKDTSWGGSIELQILAQHYKIEIIAINIQSCSEIKFGSNIKQDKCIYLLYDGIHYDIICRNITEDFEEDIDQTVFLKSDMFARNGAIALATELKKKKSYTDITNFNLQCGICFECFVGQVEAVQHGQQTGHTNFQEIKK